MTTNVHTFQLAAVLLEAASEQGEKKESLGKKISNMIKKAVAWLKNKLKDFATFFKDKVLRLDGIFKIFKEAVDRAHEFSDNRNFKGKKVMVIRAGNINNFMDEYLTNLNKLKSFFKMLDGDMSKYKNLEIENLDKVLLDMNNLIEETKEMSDTYEANIAELMKDYRKQVEVPMTEYIRDAKQHMKRALASYQLNIKVNAEVVKIMNKTVNNLEGLDKQISGYKQYKGANYEGLGLYVSRNLKLAGTILKIFFELGRALIRTIGHIVGPLFKFMKKKKEDKED